MLASGSTSFYTVKDGATYAYDIPKKSQEKIPGQDSFIILDNIRKTTEVFQKLWCVCSRFRRWYS